MITFIEKRPWKHSDPFIGATYAPTFMVKDGIEYFILNRVICGGAPNDKDLEQIKAFLTQNGGRYFRFYGIDVDPFDMVKDMAERGHTFCIFEELFVDCRNISSYGAGFVDFYGNRNEVSAAFHYRIYDMEMVQALQEAVKPIIEKRRG